VIAEPAEAEGGRGRRVMTAALNSGSNEQMFGADEQVLEHGQRDKEPYCAA
jgi:hypothetical protein